MNKSNIIAYLLAILISWTIVHDMSARTEPSKKQNIKRISLIIGCNKGNQDRTELKYAVSDARNISKVMEEMGGIQPEDNLLLGDPNRQLLFQTFDRLKARVDLLQKDHKVEVIIYYSGHSDGKGLLLGEEKIFYKELKKIIGKLNADVRIAILDSCSSGAFTRLKGGKKKKAFLIDDAYNMHGYAVMTSSSSDEASQESENLRGSFFTHNLVAGLRGAADMSGDKRVTLSEAYQYAFNETLTQTTNTFSGPQHPNYNIKMSGTGDVVMTDLRKHKTLLEFSKEIFGKIFIHDTDDRLILEFRKHPGKEMSIGLDEGKHRITVIAENKTSEAWVHLKHRQKAVLRLLDFKETNRIITRSRGANKRLRKKKKRNWHLFLEMNMNSLRTHDISQSMMGMFFGVVLKRHIILGFGGYGNLSAFKVPEKLDGQMIAGAYGGLLVGYELFPEKKINLRLTTLLGGGVEVEAKKQNIFDPNYDPFSDVGGEPFFVMEPAAHVILNMNKAIKFSFGINYRFADSTIEGVDGLAFGGSLHFRF